MGKKKNSDKNEDNKRAGDATRERRPTRIYVNG